MNRLREDGRDRIRAEQIRFAKAAAAESFVSSSTRGSDVPDLSCAVRVAWDAAEAARLGGEAARGDSSRSPSESTAAGVPVISASQLQFIFSAYGPVAAVTLRTNSALICFEQVTGATAAQSSPPPGFIVSPASKAGKASIPASTSGPDTFAEPTAGKKRPRADEPSNPVAPPKSFISHEADTLSRMMQAAAAKKQQQQQDSGPSIPAAHCNFADNPSAT